MQVQQELHDLLEKFTIQNVPIKSDEFILTKSIQCYLQYKMFLLNA